MGKWGTGHSSCVGATPAQWDSLEGNHMRIGRARYLAISVQQLASSRANRAEIAPWLELGPHMHSKGNLQSGCSISPDDGRVQPRCSQKGPENPQALAGDYYVCSWTGVRRLGAPLSSAAFKLQEPFEHSAAPQKDRKAPGMYNISLYRCFVGFSL